MKHTTEMDPELLVQPAAPGMTIPKEFGEKGLFLLNFAPVLRDDVWDDYGNKELDQAQRLRGLASRVIAIADAMDQLGNTLKAYPDPDDYEMDDYELTWEEICEEMQSTFDEGYSNLAGLVDELAYAAVGDFMD
jgi:hypothetical protein